MKADSPEAVPQNRMLLLLPTQRDCELTAQVLAREGISCFACSTPAELERELERGVGAVFVCEELLAMGAHRVLAHAVERQPRWSDLPILVLAREGGDSRQVSDALSHLGNVMLLERPLRLAALTSNVRTALRARERQYQIRQQLDDIAHANDALAETARRKDQFLAMLGHELRNPLAPIRNVVHVLMADERLPDDGREMCGMLKRQVDHMVRLVDDLIDISRISRGTIVLRREPVDLAAVLGSAIEQSRPLIDAGQHELRVDLPDGPMRVEADPVRLAQVFGNLLNNAAKYADAGGCIDVSAHPGPDGRVQIAVRDRGIGIEPEMLPHVFELFTQGRREAHRAHDGLGIGLTLVRNIVQMHGGSVEARSAGRGHGAEFIVRLPLAAAVPTAIDRPVAIADAPAAAASRVLVVDDNADAAASMGMVLDLLGIEHRVAHDGPTALDAVESFAPDVVLLDIGMPGMDGYEVARRLREDPANADLRVIALTGWSQPQDRERTRAAGFDQHLSKPVDIGALQALLTGTGHPGPRHLAAAPSVRRAATG